LFIVCSFVPYANSSQISSIKLLYISLCAGAKNVVVGTKAVRMMKPRIIEVTVKTLCVLVVVKWNPITTHTWRVLGNMLHKQLLTADKGWSSSLDVE